MLFCCTAPQEQAPCGHGRGWVMSATLTISSKNYSSWSLRGWLLCKLAGLEVTEEVVPVDADSRAELLLLSPSVRVPRLTHDGVSVWDTLAIAGYLNEVFPEAGMYPADPKARAHCRSITGEIHSGFFNLRSALPMNLHSQFKTFKIFSGAKPDIERIEDIWGDCLARYGGPFLFGKKPTIADAMFAPVATRFVTYDVPLGEAAAAYRDTIMGWEPMKEWIAAAKAEPVEMQELEVEF
ncbi:glutathione S-transferase family protein [Sphingomonas sp. AP4-R1]|nr:glutathione S-transferase family protein [Sphingomonas sp. AP4-R1]